LYTAGFNAGVVNNRGESVLSLAVAKNREAARFLISKKLDISIPNIGTVLNMLATRGDWELFKAAIDAGVDINLTRSSGSGHTLLCSALTGSWDENRERIIRYLLVECGISPNEKCEDGGCSYAILKSASLGPGAIRLLLEHGADIEAQDAMGRRPIHIAAFGQNSSVEYLVEHGADLQPRTVTLMTPLHFAAAFGRSLSLFLEIWDRFTDNNNVPTSNIRTTDKRVDDDEETNKGENGIQQTKCEKKKSWPRLSINDKDIDDWTPLMWAAKRTFSDTDNIQELCERGADLWMRGKVLDVRQGDMMWSPLKISRYFGAEKNVHEALTPSEKIRKLPDGREERWDDEEHETREAEFSFVDCSYCMMVSTVLLRFLHLLLSPSPSPSPSLFSFLSFFPFHLSLFAHFSPL
jgi:ankyrin repeat protein